MFSYPNNFIMSGYFSYNVATYGYGYYWTANAYSASNAYFFQIGNWNSGSILNTRKTFGYSVRCTTE